MANKVELAILMRDRTRQGIQSASAGVDGLSADYEELVRAIRASETEMERSGQTARRMSSDYGNLQSMLLKLGGTATLASLGKEIINVRGEIQMMEKSFEVLTGSEQAAGEMLQQLKDIAVKSPLELTTIADAAQRLLSFNFSAEETVELLKQFSDLSMGDAVKFGTLATQFGQMSSVGKVLTQDLRAIQGSFNPLNEIARTTGKSIEEVAQAMEDGKITVDMVRESFRTATSEGGKFYEMTEKQAEGLAGLKASLSDAWTNMLNEIGKGNQNLISEGYKLTTSLVQNYETVGRVLLSLIATYGAYKTAVLLNIVAEQGWMTTQMQMGVVMAKVNNIMKALNATMMKHPAAIVAAAIVGLVTTIWALRDSTTAEEKALNALNEQMGKYNQGVDERKNKADQLIRVIKDETETEQAKLRALKELQALYPSIFDNMDVEAVKLANEINLKKQRNQEEEKYTKEQYKQMLAEAEARKANLEYQGTHTPGQQTSLISNQIKQVDARIAEIKESLQELETVEQEVQKTPVFSDINNELKTAQDNVDTLKQKLSDLRSGKTQSTNYAKDIEETATALAEAEKNLASLTGRDKKTVSSETKASDKAKKDAQEQADLLVKIKNGESKASLERRQTALDNEQKLLDIQKDGWDKRQKQIELDYKKELLAIDRHARELIEKQQEAERMQWEKEGKKGTFTPKTTGILQLPREQKNQLISEEATLNKVTAAETAQMLKDQLEPYRTFSQQRIDLEKKYQEDIAALRKSGASEENIQVAEQKHTDVLAALDETMAQKEETFKALMMQIGYMSLQQLEKALGDAEKALRQSEATSGKDSKQTGVLRAKIKKLQEEIKAVKAEEEVKKTDDVEKWRKSSKAIRDCKKEIDGMLDSMDFLDESTRDALKAASNIADGAIAMIEGIRYLGTTAAASISAVEKASVILAIVGAAVQIITAIFNMASKAEAEHQKALAEVQKNRIAMQREYNLLLLEQNLLLEEATSIFGEKQIEKAANAMKVYAEAVAQFGKELKGDAPVKLSGWLGEATKYAYQKRLDAYNQGIGALNQISVKTGHHKTGLFGWGKGKDEYTSILDVYDDILTAEGKLNVVRAKAILDTQTMSDADKERLQYLIDLQEKAEEAQEALRDYLQETFGVLGEDLMDSIVASIQDKGVNAWEAFGDAGSKVIEDLGKQLAYELFFAKRFSRLQEDLEAVYGKTSDPEETARQQMELVGQFYNTIGQDMEAAKAFMENWQKKAAEYGFDIWQAEGSSQSGKAGAFTTMTQDQGTKLEGLFTSVQNHTASIDEQITDMSRAMFDSLDCLLRIEENTSYCKLLEDIADDIAQIKRDGLKVK
jgi:tape measure domain-containing protein